MLRASATIRQWPGTTLPAVPPSIVPTFAVVPSSRRPRCIREIAADAAAIALLPSSGLIPAWASTPVNSATTCCWVGVLVITSPTALAWSRMKPQSERSVAGSTAFAPRSPCSSATVSSSSIPTGGGSSAWRATSSTKTATAALLSAPRIVSPRLRKTPSSSTTSIRPGCGTVSMWAQNIAQASLRPGRRARRLPDPACAGPAASSSLTSRPIARRSALSESATSRSSPVTLRISQSLANLSCSLSTPERLRTNGRPRNPRGRGRPLRPASRRRGAPPPRRSRGTAARADSVAS